MSRILGRRSRHRPRPVKRAARVRPQTARLNGLEFSSGMANPQPLAGEPYFMTEIHFVVEEAPEGGLTARAVGSDIFTEADDLDALRAQVRDAVHCHFDAGQAPALIRLHITREEVLAA